MRLMLREMLSLVAKQRYQAQWVNKVIFPMEAEVGR
jgi:hypothetical protein